MEKKVKISWIAPVLMSFFIMSIIDLVGISVDKVKEDMQLSNTLVQLIPSVTFLWFFLLSVPVGIMQARIGKRLMLNIGMGITALGLLIPYFYYSFSMVLLCFIFLGIGNTIIQVSANPLLVDVVPQNRASSFLSFSQFVKAIGSMAGPPVAAVMASRFGDWKLMYVAFGAISILTIIWLGSVKINESQQNETKATIASSFKLLGTNYILIMVIAIFLVVGIDVAFNSNSGQFLMNRIGVEPEAAKMGRSVYFFGRLLGTLAGAVLLTKISSRKILLWSSILGIITFGTLLLIRSQIIAWILVFVTGIAIATIFPIVFALSVEKFPTRNNEISGLIMMAISGGAVLPLLVGGLSDISNIAVGMTILLLCWFYLLGVSIYALKQEKLNSKVITNEGKN
ncbi:MAG TPA: MFS transporter [Bacteroidales bacterium]|nr:MFS transporter [Bacteroidales bacterium]HQG36705.1 MFS transporter [Bacteroidales bacterium]HQG52713.1 MFS transporter [Bacteroidales bacterium]HQJ20418.1 MFS transporter [Bacteroidales bacterium]